ncbi:hypothetical protein ADEAN_000389300 [Angomonas deanei]|uniref:Uncharacterized protein n=1 Tax=Angomonas deanei TaxID=59799 RepID=A0A7G2CBH7_9TRYP|nr:hypothetical protein ADEAN_000389300 [Angomonas deanei]
MAAAVELLNDLELLDQYFSSLGSFSSVKEYHLFVKERERVFGSSHRWIDRLSSSTYDIVQDLVHQQLELNTLRGRRAKRLSGEKYANSNWKLTVTGRKGSRRYFLDEREAPTHKSGSIKKKRGGLSIDNAVDDFKRLYAFFAKIGRSVKEWIFTNPVPGGGKYKKVDKKDYVAYSEPFLEGYDLFEEVTVADKEEREQCLSIARKMVRSTRLLQDLFIEFFSIMAIDSFEAFGDGSVQPHFYGKEDTGDGLNSFKPFFSSDELVKVAFIRRYASLLVNINPLVPNEHMRHFKAIARSKASSEFAKMEQQLKESNRSTSKEELQMAFAESIRAEAADRTQGLYPLRNMVEEFKFWERNEELWMEHILSSLSLEQQRHLVQTHPKTASSDLGKDNRSAEDLFSDQLIVKWINLPIFKGLLCFTEQPDAYTVARGRSEERAERDGTKEYPFKEHKRYETLLAEVKGRWVNELELLKLSLHHINHPSASTKALRLSSLDTSSPHLANVTNSRRQFFTIIDRIGKHYISAFDEQKFSLIKFAGRLLTSVLPFVKSPKEGDGFSSLSRQISVSDPSVQVTIANVVDIPWATFHDMSLNILENIVSVSPDTLHFKKKLSRGVTVSTFILLLSVAILGTLAFVL